MTTRRGHTKALNNHISNNVDDGDCGRAQVRFSFYLMQFYSVFSFIAHRRQRQLQLRLNYNNGNDGEGEVGDDDHGEGEDDDGAVLRQ